MADAGRILIMPKGTYDSVIPYEKLDLVKHNDSVWLAKKDSIGIEPSDANEEYWFRMTSGANASSLGGKTAEEWQAEIDAIVNGNTVVQNASNAINAETANSVPWSGIREKPSNYTPSSHNQSASTITTGRFAGRVYANESTMAVLGDSQVRDAVILTSATEGATTSLANGTIVFSKE